ncbi:2-dehydro-3-deoxy-D-gluconate 5-dehydrogenase KduD [Rubrobacter taiwanensis]
MYMQEMFSLRGKTALVTGARTGMGQAIAIGLAKAGADLILLGRRPDMQETRTLVTETGRRAETVVLDLSDPDLVQWRGREIAERYRIDVLVNNAGIIRREPAIEFSRESWDSVIQTNLSSLFLLTQPIARPMLERGEGKIINVASVLSFQGGINVASYAASKHAVAGLTKTLANEWGPYGVQVNAIAPGYIETKNTEPLRRDEERNASILARIPAGRWGKPEDISGAAVFLASRASDYVNGHILVVDGGWLAR